MDRIVLLGTKGGPSISKGSRNPSSSLLQIGEDSFVIDCGIGVSRSLAEADVAPHKITAIFITHLHSDHLLELGPLVYTAWTSGLTTPLTIYGPEGIEGYWDGFMQSMSFDHDIRTNDDKRTPLSEFVTVKTYLEGTVATHGDLSVTSLRVDHPPVEHCYALRFDAANSSVVFSADTCYFPPLVDFANNADVLVHEAMLGAGIDALVKRIKGAPGLRAHLVASHTLVEDVGRIATAANVEQLVINHLVPGDTTDFTDDDWATAIKGTWSGKFSVGTDGLVIALTHRIKSAHC